MARAKQKAATKEFYVNIEGVEWPWDGKIITVKQMRELASLPPDLSVVEEFPDGTERTLADTDTVLLKLGHRYGRAPRFRRG
jgi:hypothetical protein